MSEKPIEKKSGRVVAITLGIICIILAVGLVGAVANYTSIISGKDNTIATKDSQISSLNSQIDDLTQMIYLVKSEIWINQQTVSQSAYSYTYWTHSIGVHGYISVNVQTSTTTNTYVRVIWSSHGINYDNQITVGTSGTANFPVLQTSSVEIRVGNTNLFNGATETVTITYYY
jgi:hypothetical protein